jgi:hypothetical protein
MRPIQAGIFRKEGESAPMAGPRHTLRKRIFISPAGALLAAVCFFLPWGQFSCAGMSRTLSGAEIGGVFWIVFAAALAIPPTLAAGWVLRRLRLARIGVAGLALLALGILFFEQIGFARGQETGFGRVHAQNVGVQLRPGGAGTVLGLLIALAGSTLPGWRRRLEDTPRRTPSP